MVSSPVRLGIALGGDSLFLAAGEWSDGIFHLLRLGRYRFAESVTEALVRETAQTSGIRASISEWVTQFSPESIRVHSPCFLECWTQEPSDGQRFSQPREERKALGLLFPSHHLLSGSGVAGGSGKVGGSGGTGGAGDSASSTEPLPHASLRKAVYAPFKGSELINAGADRLQIIRERSMTDQVRAHAPGITRSILSEPELGASLVRFLAHRPGRSIGRTSPEAPPTAGATEVQPPASLLSVFTHANGCSLSGFDSGCFLGATQIPFQVPDDLSYLLPRYAMELPWLNRTFEHIVVCGTLSDQVLAAMSDVGMHEKALWEPTSLGALPALHSEEKSFGFSISASFPAILACLADD